MARVLDTARTLVCVPALLGRIAGEEPADGFEALGALSDDPNVEYLLAVRFFRFPRA